MNKLTIFTLCKALVELVGKEQALADLQLLYKRHPEMFRDENEVAEVIEQVVRKPDLIMKNPKAKSDKDYIVVKKSLDSQPNKMADIGISDKNGECVIFHANKQDKRNFNRFLNKAVANGEAVRSLHTPSQARMGGNEKSSGANALSSATKDNSTPNTDKSQAVESKPKYRAAKSRKIAHSEISSIRDIDMQTKPKQRKNK